MTRRGPKRNQILQRTKKSVEGARPCLGTSLRHEEFERFQANPVVEGSAGHFLPLGALLGSEHVQNFGDGAVDGAFAAFVATRRRAAVELAGRAATECFRPGPLAEFAERRTFGMKAVGTLAILRPRSARRMAV